jgi:hypothetical protein
LSVSIRVGSYSIGLSQLLRLVADAIDQTKQKNLVIRYEEFNDFPCYQALGSGSQQQQQQQTCSNDNTQNDPKKTAVSEKQTLMLRYIFIRSLRFIIF